MRSSVLALALPLVAALPSFPPSNDLAAGGGVVKRWKFNPNKGSNIEVTAADVDLYKKMGWTAEQIKQLDPDAPVGTQPEQEAQEPSSPSPPRGGPPDQHTGLTSNDGSVANRVPSDEGSNPLVGSSQQQVGPRIEQNAETNELSDVENVFGSSPSAASREDQDVANSRPTNHGNDWSKDWTSGSVEDILGSPPSAASPEDQDVANSRPTNHGNDWPKDRIGGGGGNEDSDNSGGSRGQAGDWLAIANEIRQSLPQNPPLLILARDDALEAAAQARSAASVSQNAQLLTHTPQEQLLGHEVMHFGKASEFREVVWGWLCEMPVELGIKEECEKVRNTRRDQTGHAEAFTNRKFTRIGCGHRASNYHGGQWTCVLK